MTGPKKGRSVDVHRGRADITARRRILARVVAALEGSVVLRRTRCLREARGEPELGQGLDSDSVEVLRSVVVDAGAESGVEAAEHVLGVVLGRGRGDADQAEGAVDEISVPVGQLVALVVQIQAHDVEPDVNVAQRLHLEDPPRGDPGEGAGGVEVEVDSGLWHGCFSCHGSDATHRVAHD